MPDKHTYEEYKLLPEETRVELIDGEFLMTPAPSTRHQKIIGELYVRLRQWAREHNLGEVLLSPCDVVLSRHDVVQPDLLFVSKGRLQIIREACVEGPPDLVIEVVSPGSKERDFVLKKELYIRFGVREYWLVHPAEETITVLGVEDRKIAREEIYCSGVTLKSDGLPGFVLPIDELFGTA